LGGDEAVDVYEEYYRIGRIGNKPVLETLNSDRVEWFGGENCDYSEDGIMAKYEQYLTPHEFILEHGREIAKNKKLMGEISTWFTEIPGGYSSGLGFGSGRHWDDLPVLEEAEFDFVDAVGQNPGLIQHDWRTQDGQQEIAGLYSA